MSVTVGDAIMIGTPSTLSHQPDEEHFRVIRVISGVFYVGVGEAFDESNLTAHAPGSMLVLPAGTTHSHWARSGEYIAQVTAIGPLGLEYVDSAQDPRPAGVRSRQ
jgi:uncharacterized RmlC-like cupin family protein